MPLPPGKFNSPSLERYFSSVENLNTIGTSGNSDDFDAVPEPDMEETPRDDLQVQGKGVNKTEPDHKVPSNVRDESKSMSKTKNVDASNKSESNKSQSITDTSKLHQNNREQQSNSINSEIERRKTFEVQMSLSDMAADSEEKDTIAQLISASKGYVRNVHDDDDETSLFTKVTDIMTDRDKSLTERLKNLGLDYDFLKDNMPAKVGDKDPVAANAEIVSIKKTADLDKSSSGRIQYTAGDILQKGLKQSVESMLHKEVPKVVPVDVSQLEHSYSSSFLQKPSRDSLLSSSSSEEQVLEESMGRSSTDTQTLKKCQDCGAMNKDFLEWCLECGSVIEGKDPMKTTPKKAKLTSSSMNDVRNVVINPEDIFKSKLEQSFSAGTPQIVVEEEKRGHGDYDKLTEEGKGKKFSILQRREMSLTVDNIDDAWLKESDDFEYEQEERPSGRMSEGLKAELSINLDASANSLSHSQKQRRQVEDNLVKLSENIDFEYISISDQDSPKKMLSPELQEELTLDLASCLEASQCAAALKQKMESQNSQVKNTENKQEKCDTLKVPRVDVSLEATEGAVGGVDVGVGNDKAVIKPVSLLDQVGDYVDVSTETVNNHLVAHQAGAIEQVYDDIPIDDGEGGDLEESEDPYKEFLMKLKTDPRFKPSKQTIQMKKMQGRPLSANTNLQPQKSQGRPQSAVQGHPSTSVSKSRPSSAVSKIRASIEAEPTPRHWEKSSLAWSSYKHGEMSKSRSTPIPSRSVLRPSSAQIGRRPVSVSQAKKSLAENGKPTKGKIRPSSAQSRLR